MQLVAFDGKITPPIPDGSELLTKVSMLINACRSSCKPIFYIQTSAISGQPYAKDMHGWEIHPQVAPLAGETVLHKVGPSGFENPELHGKLQALGIQEVIVSGIWSEGCVAYTCNSALELGYTVWLVADGHSTVRDTESEAAKVVRETNDMFSVKSASVFDTQFTREHLNG